MVDEFLECYRKNNILREYNIVAKLSIGREGEYGEYPSEPSLDYLGLDSVGFDKQFESSYIYNNISLRDIAYMVMYADLEDNYEYIVPCGSFDMVVKSIGHYHGIDVYIRLPLKVFIVKCMCNFSYKDVNHTIDTIFELYRDEGLSCVQREN